VNHIFYLCLILISIEVLFGQEITWQGEGVSWAMACNFVGNDLSSAQVSGDKCGSKCLETKGCTHFVWNNSNGGTCFMKKLSTIQKSDAIFTNNYNMVCGILAAINWQTSADGVSWALACDFFSNDLSSAKVSGDQCGATCMRTQGCTHFSWNNYNGGTCWMKRLSGGVQKSDAIFNNNYNMVCGIVSPVTTNAPIKPTTLPPLKSLMMSLMSDEFDYSGLPDPTKWTIVNAGGGFGNNEAQFYTPQNVNVSNGLLTIQARKQAWGGQQYTSGKLTSNVHFNYGVFEMRAKIPQGRGTWPAFWLLNPNNWPLYGEIDILGK